MSSFLVFLTFLGWLSAVAAQIYIIIKAFKTSALKGFLCLLIPGYILVYATNQNTRELKAALIWLGGVLLFIITLTLYP